MTIYVFKLQWKTEFLMQTKDIQFQFPVKVFKKKEKK